MEKKSPQLTIEKVLEVISTTPELAAIFSGVERAEIKRNYNFHAPTSYVKTYGGTLVGDITSLANFRDGNVLDVPEETTNGIDITFTFASVTSFERVAVGAIYIGTASHSVKLMIKEQATGTWRTLRVFRHDGNVATDGTDVEFATIDIPTAHKYISATQSVDVRFLHIGGGTNTHDLWIDYLALVS